MDRTSTAMILGAAGLVSTIAVGFVLSRPEPAIVDVGVEDPVGTKNSFKAMVTRWMVWIAQKKEMIKSTRPTRKELESWHKPEDHEFFNESHYYNGCDLVTRDRFITRISHRSNMGKKSYVFLLIDSKEHGLLFFEEDTVAETSKFPQAMGLSYHCEVPMKKWRIRFSGYMYQSFEKCLHPLDEQGKQKANKVLVEVDLTYDAESPLFWYMRDDHPTCLANNLAQESWGWDFFKVCLKRTKDHGHYEEMGRARGTIKVGKKESPMYNFGTFRDHSWDIRRWATMDKLCILLIALEKPLKLYENYEYWYLDLTLVDMPGNVNGVARYSTGYALGNNPKTPRLCLTTGTSIRDYPSKFGPPSYEGGEPERVPEDTSELIMRLAPHPRDIKPGQIAPEPRLVKIVMKGDIRRLVYWPDQGAFKVYEDYLDFQVIDMQTKASSVGYGTRQSGFRVGDFDPSKGGCG